MTVIDTAHARSTDPWTSHAAAESVSGDRLRESQLHVLSVIEDTRPATLEEIVSNYNFESEWCGLPEQSSSGIRTRVSELVRLGYVQDSGETELTRSGRQAIVWEIARLPE